MPPVCNCAIFRQLRRDCPEIGGGEARSRNDLFADFLDPVELKPKPCHEMRHRTGDRGQTLAEPMQQEILRQSAARMFLELERLGARLNHLREIAKDPRLQSRSDQVHARMDAAKLPLVMVSGEKALQL
jgi:hypothetical protein